MISEPHLQTQTVPLVVDLDGTLIKTDLLVETASQFLAKGIWRAPQLLGWLVESRCALKAHLAGRTSIDTAVLPYNEELLAWLKHEKATGRRIVLATASHRQLADSVAAHLGIFDEVLASDNDINLKAGRKRAELVRRYGERGYDYIGNDWADIEVWRSARLAHVVHGRRKLIERIQQLGIHIGRRFSATNSSAVSTSLKALRLHQWTKNLLIFVPLLAAQNFTSAAIFNALLAFIIVGITASSVYLLNDIADVFDDRHHVRKKSRAIAAGEFGLVKAWILWPIMLVAAFLCARLLLPTAFGVTLFVYYALTVAYSFYLKRIPVLDVLVLAALYTIRIIAGTAAIGVKPTFWILSFSVFIFLSLALIKRFSELKSVRKKGRDAKIRGRGYAPDDLELVSSLGSAAGYISVLVLALYIQDQHTAALYETPEIIWFACPLLLFWISRAWLISHRGQMHDDPIVFAIKDPVSWLVAALFCATFIAAKII